MKKKGFTLIEILVVVVIIGVLLLIAVPAISSYMKRGTDEYYASLEETVMLSGRDYLNDYRALLPKEVGNVTVIELKELTDNKYIENVVDSNGEKCTARVVAKKISKKDYEYYTCLSCPNYNPGGDEGEACQYDENNSITAETKNYKVVVEPDSYVIEQGEDFDLPYGKAYYIKNGKEELVSDKVVGNPKTINVNKLGKTTVTYVYKGAKKEVTVEVVDTADPNVPQVVLKYDNKNGKVYKGGWYSGDIYAEFKSTDYSKEGVTGSGIDNYQIKKADASDAEYVILKDKNNKNVNYYLNTENGELSYSVKSVDKSGNESLANTYSLKIDKVIPECAIEVKSGTPGKNNWYISNVTVGFEFTDGTVSDIVTSSINVKNSTTGATSKSTSITENGIFIVTGTLTDEAGNIGVCSSEVKIDKPRPSLALTISDGITSGNWHNANFTITSSQSNNISGNTYYYGTSSNPTTNATPTKTVKTFNTNSTSFDGQTYYFRVCSGAGLCDEKSYLVKLDKTTPEFTVVASDGIVSGSWHTANYTITASGANNVSRNTYYHGTKTNPTTEGSSDTVSTNTASTKYYYKVCSGSGLCDEKIYTAKLDKFVPTIAAKENPRYITTSSSAITSHFNIKTGVSNGTTVCKLGTKTVSATGNLSEGVNTVTCTTTSGAGLVSSPASIVFRHYYVASASCSTGSLYDSNKTCQQHIRTDVSYNCNNHPGYTLNGSTCYKTTTQSVSCQLYPSCTLYSISVTCGGMTCDSETNIPSGSTGSECARLTSSCTSWCGAQGSYSPSCNTSSLGTQRHSACGSKVTVTGSDCGNSGTCPTGYTKSGTTCSKTETGTANKVETPVYNYHIPNYSCPRNGVNGNTGDTVSPAMTSVSCPNNWCSSVPLCKF